MKFISCGDCGKAAPKRGPGQRYCEPCSTIRQVARQAKWARENPQKRDPVKQAKRLTERTAVAKKVGADAAVHVGLAFDATEPVEPLWMVRLAVPFTYRLSKNAIWAHSRMGHVYLRADAKQSRDMMTAAVREAMAGRTVVSNKLWIDIHVEKSNHKGDAINVIDSVCDAIKAAIPLDDRWYCIRRLDWSISKDRPRIILGLSQSTDVNSQACSVCGAIRPLEDFTKNASNHSGRSRECRSCKTRIREAEKAKNKERPRVEIEICEVAT